jgi:ornithine--oxo-acid transaminase
MNTAEYTRMEDTYGAHNYHPLDVVINRGEGIWVYDVDGNRFLDCLSAYSAVNHGHCHPRLVQALTGQAQQLTLTSRAFRNDKLGPFYQMLHETTGYEMVLPMNTGAEAVETAIKAARKWGYQVKQVAPDQAEIIVCDGNFHGRTTTIVGFSSEAQYQGRFWPIHARFRIGPVWRRHCAGCRYYAQHRWLPVRADSGRRRRNRSTRRLFASGSSEPSAGTTQCAAYCR